MPLESPPIVAQNKLASGLILVGFGNFLPLLDKMFISIRTGSIGVLLKRPLKIQSLALHSSWPNIRRMLSCLTGEDAL